MRFLTLLAPPLPHCAFGSIVNQEPRHRLIDQDSEGVTFFRQSSNAFKSLDELGACIHLPLHSPLPVFNRGQPAPHDTPAFIQTQTCCKGTCDVGLQHNARMLALATSTHTYTHTHTLSLPPPLPGSVLEYSADSFDEMPCRLLPPLDDAPETVEGQSKFPAHHHDHPQQQLTREGHQQSAPLSARSATTAVSANPQEPHPIFGTGKRLYLALCFECVSCLCLCLCLCLCVCVCVSVSVYL